MPRLAVLTAAALAAVAASAFAAPRKPLPQSMSWKVGRKLYKDNEIVLGGGNLARFDGAEPLRSLTLRAEFEKFAKNGTGSRAAIEFVVIGAEDPRTTTGYPVTIPPGGAPPFVGGIFTLDVTKDVQKGRGVQLATTSSGWMIDPAGATAFSFQILRFDAATRRITGKFSGALVPAPGSPPEQTNLPLKSGKFHATVEFPEGI